MTKPQTICFMDDEVMLREVVRRYLEYDGYEVLEDEMMVTEEPMMDDTMATEDAMMDDSMMVMLAPAQIPGEDPACTGLRAELDTFLLTALKDDMMMEDGQ